MNNSQNITIALLLVTAVVLGSLLVGSFSSTPAYAGSSSVKGADYILVPVEFTESSDLIVVIDVTKRRMNTYNLNRNSNSIDLVDDKMDLNKIFK